MLLLAAVTASVVAVDQIGALCESLVRPSSPRHRAEDQARVGHTGPVHLVVFSPAGKTLATGSNDSSVRLWDVASHRQLDPPLLTPRLVVRQ